MTRGDLTPVEASELSRLVETYVKTIEAVEFADRLRENGPHAPRASSTAGCAGGQSSPSDEKSRTSWIGSKSGGENSGASAHIAFSETWWALQRTIIVKCACEASPLGHKTRTVNSSGPTYPPDDL